MLLYIARRIGRWLPSMFIIVLGVYALAFYGGGDPIKLIFLRSPGDVAFNPERIEAIREQAGLNRPFVDQFLSYLGNLFQGNWGNSLITGRPVWNTITAAAPVTMQLALVTVVIVAMVGVPLGYVAARNQNKALDYLILGSALVFWAIPPYVVGPLLMVGAVIFLPAAGVPYGWGGLLDVRIILPLLALAMQPIALIVRQTRGAVIEIMSEDFIRTARAKGVPEFIVGLRHIVRPALTPVVTQLGLVMVTLINGAIFVELVFGLPGLGRLTVTATMQNDYPLLVAVTIIGAILIMITNLIVDLTYPLLDPRGRN